MGVCICGKIGISVCMRLYMVFGIVREWLKMELVGKFFLKGVGIVIFKCWRCIFVKKGIVYSLIKVGIEKKGENKILNRCI